MQRLPVLAAVSLTVAVEIEVWLTGPPATSVVAGLAPLALAAGRRRPLTVLVGIAAAVAVDGALGGVLMAETGFIFLAVLSAAVFAGLYGRDTIRLVVAAAVTIGLATLGSQIVSDEYSALDDLVWSAFVIGTPILLAWLVRSRADVVAELDAREGELRAAQAHEAEAAVAEERARLAVEVHDALAHRLGDMAMQAAGAERLAERDPARAVTALARIEASARGALDDIRAAIGVLRREETDVGLGAPHMPRSLPPAPEPRGHVVRPSARSSRPAIDALVAAVVFVALLVETLASSQREVGVVVTVIGLAIVTAPVALRTRHPLACAVAVFSAAAAYSLLLTPLTYGVTPIVLMVLPPYSVGAHLSRRPAIAGLVVCLAGSLVFEPPIGPVIAIALIWGAARLVRDRSLRAEELRAVNAALELAAGADTVRARSAERLRISRELHDAVAHRLTVIVLQAEAAQRVWESQPAAARGALTALAEVARGTLGELRVALEHGPTVAGLDELLGRVRALGVEVTVTGAAEPLDPDLFTVLREALTNAVRHAAPTQAAVELRPDRVVVTDRGGPGSGVQGTGNGLRGLAERLSARGGVLRHGPVGTGYRVEAQL